MIYLSFYPPFSTGVYHLRNLLKQVHAHRIRRVNICIFVTSSIAQSYFQRIIRLIVIGWQAAVPPTVCNISYLVVYLLFTNLWLVCLFSPHIVGLTCSTVNSLGQRKLLVRGD